METNQGELGKLISEVKQYLENRSRLSKLKAINTGSQIAGELTTVLFLALFFLLFLIFLSIAAALVISELSSNSYMGFLCISVFYLLLMIILFIKKDALIKKPLTNAVIRRLLNSKENEN